VRQVVANGRKLRGIKLTRTYSSPSIPSLGECQTRNFRTSRRTSSHVGRDNFGMGSSPNPRNLPEKATPEPTPAIPLPGTVNARPHRERRSWATIVAAILGMGTGLGMIGIAIWGLWVSADLPRYADTSISGRQQHGLNAVISLLSWLVIFGPFLLFGVAILRSTLARQERGWLVPLRVFTYFVSLRASAEAERRHWSNKPGGPGKAPSTRRP